MCGGTGDYPELGRLSVNRRGRGEATASSGVNRTGSSAESSCEGRRDQQQHAADGCGATRRWAAPNRFAIRPNAPHSVGSFQLLQGLTGVLGGACAYSAGHRATAAAQARVERVEQGRATRRPPCSGSTPPASAPPPATSPAAAPSPCTAAPHGSAACPSSAVRRQPEPQKAQRRLRDDRPADRDRVEGFLEYALSEALEVHTPRSTRSDPRLAG